MLSMLRKTHLFWAALLLPFLLSAQEQDLSLKMGGVYFINSERTVAFGDYAVMTISGDDKTGRKVDFDIFSPEGTLDASLRNGTFSGRQAHFYAVARSEGGFVVLDTRNDRVVLKVISVKNEAKQRNDLHVWADFFLPNGERFQCTPEDSNVPMMKMMKGSTFRNVGTGIQLN
jgi:hypothetical protein